jgi:predicted RNA-binding Zn-ribbon protein involved in translation (DUF1610 family)
MKNENLKNKPATIIVKRSPLQKFEAVLCVLFGHSIDHDNIEVDAGKVITTCARCGRTILLRDEKCEAFK